MTKHIVLLTPGQPSTNPRMLKEAIGFQNTGHEVSVVYCFWAKWAYSYDETIKSDNPLINWVEVGGNPYNNRFVYYYTRFRHRFFRLLNALLPKILFIAERAELRAYKEMMHAATDLDATIYIAHNLGALPIAGRIARKKGVPYSFDAEDFHRGQKPNDKLYLTRTCLLEDAYIPGAAYITTASPLFCIEYKNLYEINPETILNCFPKKFCILKTFRREGPLKLFWFSQTIGKGRGLEDIINALKLLPDGIAQLTLMGESDSNILSYIAEISLRSDGTYIPINILPPIDPDKIFQSASCYDIGLALEPGRDSNNDKAISNKIFAYVTAGIAIVFSDTIGQELFYDSYPDIGQLYQKGQPAQLAKIIQDYYDDFSLLLKHKKNASLLGFKRLNWETEFEKLKSLLSLYTKA